MIATRLFFRRLGWWVALSALAGPAPAEVSPPEPAPDAAASSEDTSAGQAGLGTISLDREARTFSVTGRVIKREQPLEYFAVKKDGYKAYESILELDTTATEFNLACILIGLKAENAVLPEYHFDPKPVVGDRVELTIEWGEGDNRRAVRPEEIFLFEGQRVADGEWVYTGSFVADDGTYLAEAAGTLIGFVHDKDSIIEHRIGIGIGNFGAVAVDTELLPEVGSPIRLTVSNPQAQEQN